MSRLTINEFPQGGFSDEIVLKPNDFEGTSAGTETISYSIPAGTAVIAAGVQVITPFSGGSLSAVTLDVGDDDDADGYIDLMDVFTGGDTFDYNSGDLLDGTTSDFKLYTSADTIDLDLISTGDGLANATAGEVKVSLALVRLG